MLKKGKNAGFKNIKNIIIRRVYIIRIIKFSNNI